MKQNNAGSTLLEIVIAIAILGAFSVAACTSLVLGLRLNDKSESMLQAQLAISSAVEILMAEGVNAESSAYDVTEAEGDRFPNVKVTTERMKDTDENELPYFKVTVTSEVEDISVTTFIREVTAG